MIQLLTLQRLNETNDVYLFSALVFLSFPHHKIKRELTEQLNTNGSWLILMHPMQPAGMGSTDETIFPRNTRTCRCSYSQACQINGSALITLHIQISDMPLHRK